MRLSGWQRLPILASVAWAIGGGLWAHNTLSGGNAKWVSYNMMCAYRGIDAPRLTSAEYENCTKVRAEIEAEDFRERLLADALIIGIPIIVGWFLLWLAGWVRAGFLKSN